MNLKKLIAQLPSNRLVVYLLIIGFLPVIFVGFQYSKKKREWEAVSEKIANIQHFAATTAFKQYPNTIVRNAFLDPDPFYFENHLEPLNFLKKEKEALEQLLKSPTFTGNEAAEKRYTYLTSTANHLEWMQGSVQIAEGMQEVPMMLSHPVETDAHDLKEILTRIEGNRKGKPQLIITDFKMGKKSHTNGNEVFELNMKLLKREFHS